MRMLMNIIFPNKQFNKSVRDGTAGAKMKKILDAVKPEAVYFTEQDGCRSAIVIVDLKDPSGIPALAEPWFLTFDASVQVRIVMSPAELKSAGLEEIGKQWSK